MKLTHFLASACCDLHLAPFKVYSAWESLKNLSLILKDTKCMSYTFPTLKHHVLEVIITHIIANYSAIRVLYISTCTLPLQGFV